METGAVKREIDKLIKQYALPHIQIRGKGVYETGGITESRIDWKYGTAEFSVKGTSLYSVRISFKGTPPFQVTSTSCTCPYAGFCKHQVAALLSMKAGLNRNVKGQLLEQAEAQLAKHGFKVSKMEPKKKVPLRNAGNPYLIPSPEKLNRKNLEEHWPPGSPQTYTLENLVWEMHENRITLYKETPNDHWHTENYVVEMEMINGLEKLGVSCSCHRPVEKLCKHAYSVLFQLLNTGEGKNFFTQFSEQNIERMARQQVEAFGLNFTKTWRKHFGVQYSSDAGFRLMPKGKYQGLVNPQGLAAPVVDEMVEVVPGRELYSPEKETETYHCGFYFDFSEDGHGHYVKLNPIVGIPESEEGLFAKKIKVLERVWRHTEIIYRQSDEAMVRLCKKLAQNEYVADNDEMLARHFALLQQLAPLLQHHPRIYINEHKRYYAQTLPKKHLQPVHFKATGPELVIHFTENAGIIHGEPFIEMEGESYPLHGNEVTQRQFFFVQCKDSLFLHRSLRDARTYDILMHNPVAASSVKRFPEVMENYWGRLARHYRLDFSQLKSYKPKDETLKPMQKELYLSEIGNFVVLKPVVLYEKDQRVEALSGGEALQVSGKEIILQKRDREFELEFIEQLRGLHPSFEKQHRSDFFHLTYQEFLEERWFLKVFPHLQENQIEVLGWKDLKKLNANPHPPKVTFSFNQKTDWFEAEASIAFGDSRISLQELKKQISTDGYVKLQDGTMGLLPEEWLQKLEKMFRHGEVKDNKLKVSTQLFSLVDQLFDEIDDQEVRAFIEDKKQKLLHFDKIREQPLPKGIKATLRDYQKSGYHWLCFLDEFKWGGILADDMGLGKTLQVITFLKHILSKTKQTNLVVVPTSLLFNWENELKKFAPSLKVHFYYGNDRLKDTTEFDKYQIVFTSYGLMTRDIELLRAYAFNYIVLDESQAIKNPTSKRYKAARLLQANNRITLTGTPIENNTFDLYAQMSFLNPGLLGSAAGFKKEYAKAIDQNRDAQKAADLQKIIKPFVLRRTKEQVATELPEKTEDILYCEMKAPQRKVYDAYRNKYRDMVLQKMDEEGVDKSRFSVLEGLTKLRQICDTPAILSGDEHHESSSAKIDLLLKHIVEKTGKHKILIFSQFVKMLKVIEEKIAKEGITYEYLDGKSSLANRQKSVANFQENEECRVFLISLKAGGTGLNLVAADYVYIVDPWWNPAVENQAIDRCYRIGQNKNVIAYRTICKDTVEEKILALQNKKKAVASDIIGTDENVLKQLGKEDIMELFG